MTFINCASRLRLDGEVSTFRRQGRSFSRNTLKMGPAGFRYMTADTVTSLGLPPRTPHNWALRIIAEVHRLRRHHDLDGTRRPDHDVAFSARITAATVLASAPRPTRMAMPSISSSIAPASRVVFRFRGRAGHVGSKGSGGGAVTTTGTKAADRAAPKQPVARFPPPGKHLLRPPFEGKPAPPGPAEENLAHIQFDLSEISNLAEILAAQRVAMNMLP